MRLNTFTEINREDGKSAKRFAKPACFFALLAFFAVVSPM
jgi:hypothetical protein